MEFNQIKNYDDFLKHIYSKSFDDILKITSNDVQEYIVRIMMNSFTDPDHINMFIDKHSPEETKEIRRALWMLLK